jgi:branched-chain amino acid aminotransferase
MPEKVFLNDNLVDLEEARVSVTDSGLLYGAGLFETMRSRNGIVFRLQDHMERLFYSAQALSIVHSHNRERIGEAIRRLLEANELADARIRLTLTGGPLAQSEPERQATLAITATAFTPYPPDYYRAGVMVILCPFRQNTTDPTHGHQTTSFLPRLLALNLARQRRATEALWFTQDSRLADGCLSSVFLVKDSILKAPPIEVPALADPARRVIRQLAQQQSLELVEKDLYIADVLEADEIFLSNVVMEVLPVVGVERHTVGEGKIGPVTKKLAEGFAQAIEQECGAGLAPPKSV